jgi:hypothetical protein
MWKELKDKFKYIYRDSGTGRFVKKAFALLNPKTTQKEKVK